MNNSVIHSQAPHQNQCFKRINHSKHDELRLDPAERIPYRKGKQDFQNHNQASCNYFHAPFPKHVNPMPPSILEGNRISAPIDEGWISCRLWVERNQEFLGYTAKKSYRFFRKIGFFGSFAVIHHGFFPKNGFFFVEDPQKLAANSAAQLDDWLPVWRRWLLPASRLFRSVDMGSLAMGHRDTVGSETGTNPTWKNMSIWNPKIFPKLLYFFHLFWNFFGDSFHLDQRQVGESGTPASLVDCRVFRYFIQGCLGFFRSGHALLHSGSGREE